MCHQVCKRGKQHWEGLRHAAAPVCLGAGPAHVALAAGAARAALRMVVEHQEVLK